MNPGTLVPNCGRAPKLPNGLLNLLGCFNSALRRNARSHGIWMWRFSKLSSKLNPDPDADAKPQLVGSQPSHNGGSEEICRPNQGPESDGK